MITYIAGVVILSSDNLSDFLPKDLSIAPVYILDKIKIG